MKDKLSELLDLLKKDLELSNWSKELNIEKQQQQFLDEVQELKEALAKKDWENYSEELGDVLWDLLKLILITEKEGRAKAEKIMEDIKNKILLRKPHLKTGKKLSAAEEFKQWQEIKAQFKK